MAFDSHFYHNDYYPVYRRINYEIEKVNEKDVHMHQLKSKSLADLHTAYGVITNFYNFTFQIVSEWNRQVYEESVTTHK